MAGAPESDGPAVADLPEGVRSVLIGWASGTVATLAPAEVPGGLVRVARFAPAKRARLGAVPLAHALDADPAFRAAVAQRMPQPSQAERPEVSAARAFLLRAPGRDELIEAVSRGEQDVDARARLEELTRERDALARELARVTVERDAARAGGSAPVEGADEALRMRRRLSDQGGRLRAVEQELAAARREHEAERGRLSAELAGARDDAQHWQRRAESERGNAEAARKELGAARAAAERGRADTDRRLELLLATLEGAATGLRREWRLVGGGADPADLVAAALPSRGAGRRSAEPTALASWLALPHAHLIVDGYNVTKSGFPELTLADQRGRLVRALAALGARTSSDITVVFDGAAVTVPAPSGRRVRVLFSPPGVIADDVIRELVGREPGGRVVVVVSSDREVADTVTRAGAWSAPASALLALLAV